MWARLRNAVLGGPRPLNILIITDGAAYTSEQQLSPILRHAALLRDRLGVVIEIRNLDDAMSLESRYLSRFAIVGLKFNFRTPANQAEHLAKHFKTRLAGAATRLVYFDGDDDLNVQWSAVLRIVDFYVKKHVFADNNAYLPSYVGKSNLTDYVARNYGVSFADDIIPKSGGVDRINIGKVHVGWNIALDAPIVELNKRISSVPSVAKDIDVLCRATVNQSSWIYPLRSIATSRIDAMSNRFRVLAPRDRVSQEKYWEEMLRSRICVSPFGYGEICWRDFEAIICGALLVKPDMGHVKTLPNLFLPGITYVPVQWDYSDLEAKCEHYLQHEGERVRIVSYARELLNSSLQPQWFLERFRELLISAKLHP